MNIVEIDGKRYHADYDDTTLTFDNGDYIPETVCICAAHNANECCCGAWDVRIEDD
jgi:hypothetical protein